MYQSRIIALAILSALLILNQYQITAVKKMMKPGGSQNITESAQQANNQKAAADAQALAAQVLPKGVPSRYGSELKVSFSEAAQAINVLAPLEQDTRQDKLAGAELERYVRIGQRTSCEYCCGARTLVFPDGSKACGCAHSAAMRGVVAYLIHQYGNEMTDDEILNEANQWKAAFFPGPTVKKYLAASGNTTSAEGIKSQVGGC